MKLIKVLFICVTLMLTSCYAKDREPLMSGDEDENPLEAEYRKLYDHTDDKTGLESIRGLHKQLDDDNDGTIEPAETCDFIRADLQKDKQQQQMRQKQFHRKDAEITVKDLWNTWKKGEVHNWTVDQTVHWLIHNVELPQYELGFRRHAVDGSKLPQLATSSSYLSKVVGVTNPIHRSKITLKAMDVVLFGPPKEIFSTWKDSIIITLLLAAISCLMMAFKQNKRSQDHLRKMATDLESLSKAEEELQDLQVKLRNSKLESLERSQQQQQQEQVEAVDVMEVSRLKEQVEVLRNELQRAEIELEDRCWIAPPVLQHWLQITYEMESQVYNAKKKAAEEQLETAKDLCEKLKKKRSSLVGAFVSTHGCSIDEVDKSILEAKMSLLEVTQDLAERTQRWRQIEALCGCPIVTNPGLGQLKNMVRVVGSGRMTSSASMARMPSDLSPDDGSSLEDPLEDGRSVTSHFVPRMTLPTSASSGSLAAPLKSGGNSIRQPILESSKESLMASEDIRELSASHILGSKSQANLLALTQSRATTSSSGNSNGSLRFGHLGNGKLQPRIGPGGRMMVKSFSHGAGSSMATTVAAMQAARASKGEDQRRNQNPGISASVSDTHLLSTASTEDESKVDFSIGVGIEDSTEPSTKQSDDSTDGSTTLQPEERTTEEEEDRSLELGDSEDSASAASDLDGVEKSNGLNKKSKKLKKFFNFSRKKEKVV